MYLIGDIGNTEVKICLFNSKKKLKKKITLKTNLITTDYLKKKLNFLNTNKNWPSIDNKIEEDITINWDI